MVKEIEVPGRFPEIVLLCSFCGRLRNITGGWEKSDRCVEKYCVTYLSHGICPDCAELQFPDEYAAICLEKRKRGTKSIPMA